MPDFAPEITVSKDDKFFISLANKGYHSFIMLGVYREGVPTILARVGKQGAFEPGDEKRSSCLMGCKYTFNTIFNHIGSALNEEFLLLSGHINYSAYDINYHQYLQFIRLLSLSSARSNKSIGSYQPSQEQPDGNVILTYQNIKKLNLSEANEKEKAIVERASELSISNTCRHTALDLIEYTQNSHAIRDVVSSKFFRISSSSAYFDNGKPDQYFYVFPLPPTAYQDDPEKMLVLNKIYRRMEDLIKKDQNGENTIAKFNALKNLYQEQAGLPKGDIFDALQSIIEWKSTNQLLINELRAQSFLGKIFTTRSSTSLMADELEKTLSSKMDPSNCVC